MRIATLVIRLLIGALSGFFNREHYTFSARLNNSWLCLNSATGHWGRWRVVIRFALYRDPPYKTNYLEDASNRWKCYNDQLMDSQRFNLAIETSSRTGSVTLGKGDDVVETTILPPQQRHAMQLLPEMERLAQTHSMTPRQIDEVYLSIGPGSFTGLRIGVTVAKVLGHVCGAKLIPVPTLDVVAQNGPAEGERLVVCLNAKGGRCFTGFYERNQANWVAVGEAALLTPQQVIEKWSDDFLLIGDHLPTEDWPAGVTQLNETFAIPRSEIVWQLGHQLAISGTDVQPVQLAPLYVRLPEAEEKWQMREEMKC